MYYEWSVSKRCNGLQRRKRLQDFRTVRSPIHWKVDQFTALSENNTLQDNLASKNLVKFSLLLSHYRMQKYRVRTKSCILTAVEIWFCRKVREDTKSKAAMLPIITHNEGRGKQRVKIGGELQMVEALPSNQKVISSKIWLVAVTEVRSAGLFLYSIQSAYKDTSEFEAELC